MAENEKRPVMQSDIEAEKKKFQGLYKLLQKILKKFGIELPDIENNKDIVETKEALDALGMVALGHAEMIEGQKEAIAEQGEALAEQGTVVSKNDQKGREDNSFAKTNTDQRKKGSSESNENLRMAKAAYETISYELEKACTGVSKSNTPDEARECLQKFESGINKLNNQLAGLNKMKSLEVANQQEGNARALFGVSVEGKVLDSDKPAPFALYKAGNEFILVENPKGIELGKQLDFENAKNCKFYSVNGRTIAPMEIAQKENVAKAFLSELQPVTYVKDGKTTVSQQGQEVIKAILDGNCSNIKTTNDIPAIRLGTTAMGVYNAKAAYDKFPALSRISKQIQETDLIAAVSFGDDEKSKSVDKLNALKEELNTVLNISADNQYLYSMNFLNYAEDIRKTFDTMIEQISNNEDVVLIYEKSLDLNKKIQELSDKFVKEQKAAVLNYDKAFECPNNMVEYEALCSDANSINILYNAMVKKTQIELREQTKVMDALTKLTSMFEKLGEPISIDKDWTQTAKLEKIKDDQFALSVHDDNSKTQITVMNDGEGGLLFYKLENVDELQNIDIDKLQKDGVPIASIIPNNNLSELTIGKEVADLDTYTLLKNEAVNVFVNVSTGSSYKDWVQTIEQAHDNVIQSKQLPAEVTNTRNILQEQIEKVLNQKSDKFKDYKINPIENGNLEIYSSKGDAIFLNFSEGGTAISSIGFARHDISERQTTAAIKADITTLTTSENVKGAVNDAILNIIKSVPMEESREKIHFLQDVKNLIRIPCETYVKNLEREIKIQETKAEVAARKTEKVGMENSQEEYASERD